MRAGGSCSWIVLLAAMLIGGCCLIPAAPAPRILPAVLDFTLIRQSTIGGVDEALQTVITDADAWAGLWERIHSVAANKPSPPAIDFEGEMIVAVFQGPVPVGGHHIEIVEITENEEDVVVRVLDVSPGAACLVTQPISQADHVVRTARVDKPVVFQIEAVVRSCE